MATLTVRRASPGKRELLFQGRTLPVGAEIDTRDYPRVTEMPGKWAQLIRLGIFDDDHLSDPEIARELREQREEFGSSRLVESKPDPVVPIDRERPLDPTDVARLEKPLTLQCGDCGFQATSSQGLKVHVGRKHKKE